MLRLLFTVLFAAVSMAVGFAKSYTETYSVKFAEKDFELIVDAGRHVVINPVDKSARFLGADKPALPVNTYQVVIPSDRRYVSSTYTVKSRVKETDIIVANSPRVVTCSEAYNVSDNTFDSKTDISYTYGVYPSENARYVSSYGWENEIFLNFIVCPFVYEIDQNGSQLYFVDSIELTVVTEDVEDRDDYISEKSEFKSFMSKSDDVNGIEIGGPIFPTEPEKVDYLIVTSEALKDAFQPLYNWKREKGLRSKIITMEEINSKYNESSEQLNLKMCLYDMWKENSLKYVLLGGDTNIIPAKGCYGCYLDDRGVLNSTVNLPTDLFYACFGRPFDWNLNGNMEVGELADYVNYTQHIILTRASVRTPEHVEAFINKVISYEHDPKYSHSILMGGCKLFGDYSVDPYMDPISDAQHFGDFLFYNFISPYWGGSRYSFYDTYTSFPGGTNYKFNGSNLMEEISKGYSFIDIICHGTNDGWTKGNNIIYHNTSADAQTNSGYSIITTSACMTNYFDHVALDCLSERFIRGKDNGITAFVSCSREGLSYYNSSNLGPSEIFNANFYKTLFDKNLSEHSFGTIVCLTKSKLGTFYEQDEMRWVLYGVNPMGDPEMPIYISTPKEFTDVKITYQEGIGFTCDTGVPGCRVCFTNVGFLNPFQKVYNNVQQCVAYVSASAKFATVCITKDGYRPLRLTLRTINSDDSMGDVGLILQTSKILSLTPNPTSGYTKISYELSDDVYSSQLMITSLSGNVENVVNLDPVSGEKTLDVSSLKKGVYVVTLIVNEQSVDSVRLIKE